ncbi:DUF4900 domain-containing protein [Deinococcus arenicola]|uniref:DUF4900 domain-containing protein n=1 Tax=Deinococcus arenicola TaxID=2994950 RepID=A0ABU4DQ88_9DEIO|nr:DUF4900 domain-containing protein [Deinococcus sp. ZS9-10]MDV6374597.1 DUF4900 domain-containing protein [Deinococcus sp. ZS9-10]
MIVIVLFMLILLAGVLAASLQLGLSSRQSTADQASTLRAQYAAESGLALARSRLQDVQAMLSFSSPRITGGAGLKLAPNVKISAVQDWVSRLCGTATWQDMYDGRQPGARGFLDKTPAPDDDADEKFYPSAQKCTPAGLTLSSQFALFANIVTPEAYQILPASEAPATNTEARQVFWQNLLTQTGKSTAGSTTLTSKVGIDRVLRLTSNHSRIYLAVRELNAAATEGTAGRIRRTITASGTQTGLWWFDIVQPSLLDATIQTDYQTSATGGVIYFTSRTNFQGPLKTNDVFAFSNTSGSNTPSFSGKLTSAGCINRTETAIDITCTREPGVRVGSGSNPTLNRNFTGTDSAKSTAIQSYIANNSVNINYNGITPNFAGQYQPFPTNSGNQSNAANGLDESGQPLINERGLVLGSTQVGVQLYVGDANGNQVTQYDAAQRKWTEPNPAYQYIKPATSVSCNSDFDVNGCTYTYSSTIYRVDANKNISQKTGNGAWTAVSGKFNGVIYKAGGVSILGPGRGTSTSSDSVTAARPALASFSGITLAATGDVAIRSDLAMSQTPCTYDEYTTIQVQPPCADRNNVMGIFSSTGDVTVSRQAPDNVVLQTAMMSSQQEFNVEGYDNIDRGSRGVVKFTGSLVEKYYGPNGLSGTRCVTYYSNGNCRTTQPFEAGYGRDYSYDRRFLDGLAPPYYPVSPKWDFYDASSRDGDFSDLLWKQATAP